MKITRIEAITPVSRIEPVRCIEKITKVSRINPINPIEETVKVPKIKHNIIRDENREEHVDITIADPVFLIY